MHSESKKYAAVKIVVWDWERAVKPTQIELFVRAYVAFSAEIACIDS